MSEDEIRGLEGRELDLMVHVCIVDSDPVWLLPQNRSRVPKYSSDIAAAFREVDRPEWSVELFVDRLGRTGEWFISLRFAGSPCECVEGVYYRKTVTHPTPADHAKARCIAALLLAAKIGE
jgi:hypothetical protein